jgi:hypothetical protein
MTVSANRKYARQTIAFSRTRRVRQFWAAMAVALRETGRRPNDAFRRPDASRGVAAMGHSGRV